MTQDLDNQNRSLIESVPNQVKRLEIFGELLIQSYDETTLTEKGHMLSLILTGARRLKKSIDKVSAAQRKTLLLKTDFDARKVKGTLGGILGKIDSYITQPSPDTKEVIFELLDTDNAEALLSGDEMGGAHQGMRRYLIENYYGIYSKIRDSAKRAEGELDKLSQLQRAIEQDQQNRESIWKMMQNDYKDNEWPDQKATIDYRIQQEKDDPDNGKMSEAQILSREQKRIEIDHLAGIHKRELKELNQTVIDNRHSPLDVVMKHRGMLREEDLSDYFCFYYSNSYLRDAQEALSLRQASDYDLLFYNKAAQEYVEKMVPVLKEYGGINGKGHYGILKLVFQDLRLTDPDKANGVQMVNFVNAKMISDKDEKMPGQDSITKVTRKLNKQSFAMLGNDGLDKTSLNANDYARMKEIYWRCFTILNYYKLLDVAEAEYDAYLHQPHKVAKEHDLWKEVEDSTKNRLTFLASVLRGEMQVF